MVDAVTNRERIGTRPASQLLDLDQLDLDQLVQQHREEPRESAPAVVQCFRSRSVLVTGAAGSIGSELVRQICELKAGRLIVLDQDENSVFELMNEIGGKENPIEIIPVIGDVRDRASLRHTFDAWRPQIVLHAAAYKHVPLMEANSPAAVLNNVSATRELADAAIEFECERMVMISTDKAVRPSSVMGATKRVAEMLIQHRAAEAQQRRRKTQFACVRFGNVLGSRGSVVPIFLRQIAAGGPVTITHREMTRYFMTIPQAVELVLQAASLAASGDVYMLEMGDPVSIMDLARELIRLSGLTLGKDIEIEVVGIRPGEKLHEEPWSEDSLVSATEFAHVFRGAAQPLPMDFPAMLEALEMAAREHNASLIDALLRAMPIDYRKARQEAAPMANVT
jgi:FlaA1/EpsC-like NDP-sugar epimerase